MLTSVLYSESGGTYKTTMTANLAVAFDRMGLDVLAIDLDPQEANLTRLFGVGEHRGDPSADNVVKHILERPDGDFADLIETSEEGIDIVPSHDMLSDFTRNLEHKITHEISMSDMSRDEYPRYELLYDLLWERADVRDQYDVVLIDPNARAEDLLYNAIYALRNLVAPVKPAGKGSLSLDGLDTMVSNLEDQLGVTVGLSCVVPCEVGRTNASERYLEEFEEDGFNIPVTIGKRESLMDEMWEAQGSAFKVLEERWQTQTGDDAGSAAGTRRVRDREVETLQALWNLAGFVATETFDENIQKQTVLSIDGHDDRTLRYQPAEREVKA